ncbi:MAG: hypothetical protein YSLV7_ORF23 [Yellowstone Lake virophage 7]|uniref:hypothetical protein n=1 Tax=Yellowstone Lake virophage 7 TaxID=1557035 RepID=UPI0005362266|nr:MAG: hypothetical protein ASQ67_gp23 [Yellowstone Lake virophage 7]AIW01942.1 MAG: hypothetical protein YSLV7_ORF23 [Yellowstone Lake virophage 7]
MRIIAYMFFLCGFLYVFYFLGKRGIQNFYYKNISVSPFFPKNKNKNKYIYAIIQMTK